MRQETQLIVGAALIALLLVAFSAGAPATYQVTLDVEDPCFEILSGAWTLSKTGTYLAYYRWTISGPGTGSARARWIAEGLPAGTYTVEFYADDGDYPTDARYQVISAGGVSDLTVNMNHLATGWHQIGTFPIQRVCVVNVSDLWTGAGTTMMVDALRFTLTSELPPPPASAVLPHVGLCIDDAGAANPTSPSTPIYQILRLPFHVTVAVMPQQSYTVQTASEVDRLGSEVILHQPMAAITVPNPGAGGITDAMTLTQVRQTVAANLDALPHVVGMNNHMGSLITQEPDKMGVCMEELASRGLFFYDSRTITTSVGFDVARQSGLLTGERDLFIDGNSEAEAVELIRSLALQALYAPEVPHLAIGHVRSGTASALTAMAPELEAMGVEVWPLSRCMAQVIETDFTPAGCAFTTEGDWISDPSDVFSKSLRDDHALMVGDPAATRTDRALFTPSLPHPGLYDIWTIWPGDETNSAEIIARISHRGGASEIAVDQSQSPNTWNYLGRFACDAGSGATVELSDENATTPDRPFRADAVRYEYAGPLPQLPVGLSLR